jgi:hypothetical protein
VRIDVDEAGVVFDQLEREVFQQGRLTDAGLADDVEMTRQLLGREREQFGAATCVVLSDLHRVRSAPSATDRIVDNLTVRRCSRCCEHPRVRLDCGGWSELTSLNERGLIIAWGAPYRHEVYRKHAREPCRK